MTPTGNKRSASLLVCDIWMELVERIYVFNTKIPNSLLVQAVQLIDG